MNKAELQAKVRSLRAEIKRLAHAAQDTDRVTWMQDNLIGNVIGPRGKIARSWLVVSSKATLRDAVDELRKSSGPAVHHTLEGETLTEVQLVRRWKPVKLKKGKKHAR